MLRIHRLQLSRQITRRSDRLTTGKVATHVCEGSRTSGHRRREWEQLRQLITRTSCRNRDDDAEWEVMPSNLRQQRLRGVRVTNDDDLRVAGMPRRQRAQHHRYRATSSTNSWTVPGERALRLSAQTFVAGEVRQRQRVER